uniref:Uncharacterized protein n=1 Tax=Rhizophora mucronata TaxID=61149 RepID=A0A2P2NTX2_RHIMU
MQTFSITDIFLDGINPYLHSKLRHSWITASLSVRNGFKHHFSCLLINYYNHLIPVW